LYEKKVAVSLLLMIFVLTALGDGWPGERFVDNNNGTVTDTRTGLVWVKNANVFGRMPWRIAGALCQMLKSGMAGLTDGSAAGDWRLPGKEELQGIGTDPPAVWEGGNAPDDVSWIMPDAPFVNVEPTGLRSARYWTSTIYNENIFYKGSPFSINLRDGDTDVYAGKFRLFYVWPVRGGN
jgi:hypothetical protein